LSFWLTGIIIIIFLLGFFSGRVFSDFYNTKLKFLWGREKTETLEEAVKPYSPQSSQEEAVMKVVEESSPAVVSIIVKKEIPVYRTHYRNPFEGFEDFFGDDFGIRFKIPEYKQEGTEEKKVAEGTGFIVSEEGLILTNKHVVNQEEAFYTIITNEEKRYEAEVLAKDPFQDLAVMKVSVEGKINKEGKLSLNNFPTLKLGDSQTIRIGQTVIAIGNALGEFRNTISLGVISGLGRRITASGGGLVETLEDVIQTDAAINQGNSGGPLLNLRGEVIGINVAMAQGAQSIGFAIPVDKAKRGIKQIKEIGKIVYPFLGVRYILITPEVQEERNLEVDYGALVIGEDGVLGVVEDSAAAKAGIKDGDIILKVDEEKITNDNSLSRIIQDKLPGDKAVLEILREGEKKLIEVILGEKTS